METRDEEVRPTPEQARAALADAEQVRASAGALSATPWPTWFVAVTTAMLVILPIALGGALAKPEWLMPQLAWIVAMLASEAAFMVLFVLAGRRWMARTGVALRVDVLPKAATVSALIGLLVLVIGSAYAFQVTGHSWWLFGAAAIAAVVSICFHLWFVRLHRRQS